MIHLRKAKLQKQEMIQVYNSTIRSIIEFCSPVYSSMLTAGQSNRLENLQAKVTRIVFGSDQTREERLTLAGLCPLQERRVARCRKFANKCLDSDRFKHWFLPHENTCSMRLRKTLNVQEYQALTNRRYNSPLFYLRRVLNDPAATTNGAAGSFKTLLR